MAAMTGLRQPQPGRAHRPVPVGLGAVAGRGADGPQVGAGAERAALAVQDGDRGVRVGVEGPEGSARAAAVTPSTALRACGRDSRTVVTGPSRSTVTDCMRRTVRLSRRGGRSPPDRASTGSPARELGQHDLLHERTARQVAVPDPGIGAHRLHGQVQRAVQPGGVRRRDGLVLRRPDRDPGRAVGGLVAAVEAGQQVAVARHLLAAERALAGRDVAGQVGEGRAVVRRAERDHPADDVGVPVGHPEPRDQPARRVADDVDAVLAGAGEGRVGRLRPGRRRSR